MKIGVSCQQLILNDCGLDRTNYLSYQYQLPTH